MWVLAGSRNRVVSCIQLYCNDFCQINRYIEEKFGSWGVFTIFRASGKLFGNEVSLIGFGNCYVSNNKMLRDACMFWKWIF